MISSTCRIVLRSCNVRNATPFFATSKSTILKRQQNAMNAICARFLNDDVEPIDAVKAAVKKHRTKTPEPPKVTLLDSKNNVIAVTTKDDAEKMALHKNLKLVHIVDKDLRSTRPVYRLMSDAQYLEEELARKRQLKEEKKANKESFLKGEKTILLSANITQNDLQVKLKKTLKWSEKRFEVRVVISGSAENTAPQVSSELNVFIPVSHIMKYDHHFRGKKLSVSCY